jgi:hypothetical protein
MESDFKEICPVKKMIAMLGMSKARFYQHLKNDVFPQPLYCIRTKRPFYPENLQQQCLDIRRTGIGYNGIPVFFYTPRKAENRKSKEKTNNDYIEIIEALKNVSIKVTDKEIKAALCKLNITVLTEGPINGEVFKKLINYFTQKHQNGV